MDNHHAIEILVDQKLREARAEAGRQRMIVSCRRRRLAIRERLGAALMSLGERLPGQSAHPR